MGIELVTVAYGPDATAALRDAVAAAKAGDPLAPVTVVVPSSHQFGPLNRFARNVPTARWRPG